MTTKHTPGPWKAEGQRVSAPGILSVCLCNANGQDPFANARLIAAAPDLLAFAQAYLDAWPAAGSEDMLAVQARAAIAKATK